MAVPYFFEDKLVAFDDAQHGHGFNMHYYQFDKTKGLSYLGKVKMKHYQLTAYEDAMEYPYSDGRIYMRSMKGIASYDFRASSQPSAVIKPLQKVNLGRNGTLWSGFRLNGQSDFLKGKSSYFDLQ